MTGRTRRPQAGRRASLPPVDWAAPERLTVTDEVCTVLFIEEKGAASKVYDFSTLRLAPEVQRWLARSFATITQRGGIKRVGAANSLWGGVRFLESVLRDAEPAPQAPRQITTGHVAAVFLAAPVQSKKVVIERLRWLLREDQELPAATREAILHGRKPDYEPKLQPYDDREHREIMIAARRAIRVARDRIAEGRQMLQRYRDGELGPPGRGRWPEKLGQALDALDRTGELPRVVTPSTSAFGAHPGWVDKLGGARRLYPMLTLTCSELVAFALLLVDLTRENYGTIAEWPAVHFRPDGGSGTPALALVDEVKPRRGPSLEFMATPLEDLPSSLGSLFTEADDDKHLMRSPLRLYLLLLDLSELARRHAGADRAFCRPTPSGPFGKRWHSGLPSWAVGHWAKEHGFPLAAPTRPDGRGNAGGPGESGAGDKEVPAPDGKPSVNVLRLRRFALERGGKPVAHTKETFHDHYLKTSKPAAARGRVVMREALDGEVAKARAVQEVPVLTAAFLDRAEREPQQAAAEAGVDAATLKRVVSGEQDTVLLACTDLNNSPVTGSGRPCGASFLEDCLRCENARALPRQLPIQVEVHDRLKVLRSNVDVRIWDYRYADPFSRLSGLLGHYSQAERDDARSRLSVVEQALVDDLMSGRLDLR